VGVLCQKLLQPQAMITEQDYEQAFAVAFRDHMPFDVLKGILNELTRDFGSALAQVPPNRIGDSKVAVLTDRNVQVTFQYGTLDERLTSLNVESVDDLNVQIRNWSDVAVFFNHLDPEGRLSATLTTQDGHLLWKEGSDDVFAIGSTFKLYILGALHQSIVQRLHRWDQEIPIHEDWKSLPSGTMQNLPAGQPVRLLEYAKKMIAISDNTATDHLLHILGRERVESVLTEMGSAHESRLRPFLSTAEMFKLKWAVTPAETEAYVDGDEASRRALVERLASVPRSAIGSNGVSMAEPAHIDTIEWFATTQEQCQAMMWLMAQESPEIREVLSQNVPFLTGVGSASSPWLYAGYKGGSEPGVISMTFGLETKSGQRACLSVSWNNKYRALSQFRFFDGVQKILRFAEKQLN
jgi:hypothetical protein